MAQDGPRWGLNGHLGAILGGILGHFLDLGRDFCKTGRSVKSNNPSAFWLEIENPRVCLGASWGLSCAILAISWVMLCNFGAMLGHFWQHVGAKMPKMSQDRRTWVQKGWLKALKYAKPGAAVGV